MRKITSEAVGAFQNAGNYKSGNTEVVSERGELGTYQTSIFLHGNEIANDKNGQLTITSSGWKTATTKERLNAIVGVHIQQKAGKWYLNGKEWSGDWVRVNQESGEWSYDIKK
jgi:hypothetical protein